MNNESTTNTINIGVEQNPNLDQIVFQTFGIYPDMDKNDFNTSVRNRMAYENTYWAKYNLKSHQETNYKYWVGDQVDGSTLRDDVEKDVENVILRNLETIIPIATSRTPEVTATPAYKDDKTRAYCQKIRSIMRTEWEVIQHMQQEMGRGIRNHQINRLGVVMLGYDPEEDKFWSKEILATDCVISKNGDFVARYIKDETVGDLVKKFPDKAKDILGHFQASSDKTVKDLMDSPAEYIEVWTDTTLGWILNNITLDVVKNPHFDYAGVSIQQPDPTTGVMNKTKVTFNYFKKPRMPFLFMQYLNRGVHIYDDTTLVEQAIGVQNWINKRKRQIGMNADTTNGHWVSSGDFISREEFDKIEGGIDEKIWLQNGLPANGLIKLTGQPMPDYIYNDLLDSRTAADNIMGTHSTTRGDQSNNNTLGQDVLQKDQDTGRIDGYVRDTIEKFAQAWFEMMYHLYLVYRVDEKSIAVPEDDDFEAENILFSRESIPLVNKKDGSYEPVSIVFKVKHGSTLPEDEVMNYTRADKVKDMVSALDYFKMLNLPNPRELYKNFLIQQVDPFHFVNNDPEIIQIQQKIAMQNQAKNAAATKNMQGQGVLDENGQPTPAATPDKSNPNGVANAMQAAIQSGAVDPKRLQQSVGMA